jgi:hypothetical protein
MIDEEIRLCKWTNCQEYFVNPSEEDEGIKAKQSCENDERGCCSWTWPLYSVFNDAND